jgi:hypothetical protein
LTRTPEGSEVPVDRDALMDDIRRRVAEKKASGLYTVDALARSSHIHVEPLHPDDLAELGRIIEITPNLDLARSDRSGVGRAIGVVKHGLVRATSQPLLDAAEQTSAFNALLLAYVTELSSEVMRLRALLEANEVKTEGEGD